MRNLAVFFVLASYDAGCASTSTPTRARVSPAPSLAADTAVESSEDVEESMPTERAAQRISFDGMAAEPEATEELRTQPRRPNMPSMLPSVLTGPHGAVPASMMDVSDE